jgi:hypothetical protein
MSTTQSGRGITRAGLAYGVAPSFTGLLVYDEASSIGRFGYGDQRVVEQQRRMPSQHRQ